MEITRWRSKDGDAISNYVLLQSHLCLKLDQASKDGLGPEAVFDAETVQRIDAKLATFQRVGERHKLH
jgi:Mn-dependent DtxR family transcriptional regulator